MALGDLWNRTLVYFGIAEEDEWDDDYAATEELERGYEERRANVRRLSPRKRDKDPDDWTEPPAQREEPRPARLRRIDTSAPAGPAAPHRPFRPRRPRAGERAPGHSAQLQRRPADRRQVQGVDPGDPESAGVGRRALEAPDRLRQRPDVRARGRHAASRRQGLPPPPAERPGERRRTRAPSRTRRLF